MVDWLRELFRYQAHADAAMLTAAMRNEVAAQDPKLLELFHHILVAHRFWLHLSQGLPFEMVAEKAVPETLDAVAARFQATQARERAWLGGLTELDLSRTLEAQRIPGGQVVLGEALMQVLLHSQGHRAQCAARLRALGGEPPMLDYILWVKDKQDPVW